MNSVFILICEAPLPIDGVNGTFYSGIDRMPWSCIDDMKYSGKLPDSLICLRNESLCNFVGNLSFGTLNSIDDVTRLARACGSENGRYLAVVELQPIGRLPGVCNDDCVASQFAGFDGFVDGYGSIIRLGVVEKPECFRPVLDTINANGLFTSVDAASRYLDHYTRVMESENLEIIQLSTPVWIYGLRDLNRAVK
jgi:hypothetical protein